jgi:F420-dependent oxidoreductase-like protein
MKLGVMIEGQEGIGWQEWRNIVQWTEELGFESLWRSDHFFSFGRDRTKDALETFASLVHVAENSRRIRFGTLVCAMTFRHPAMTARMAAAVDQLSGGRFILGLGAGWNAAEHEAFGITLPPPRERSDMLEEGTAYIRALFDNDPASFNGKVYQLKDAYMYPRPAQMPLPILVGGGGEKRTLRTAARYADEWNSIGAAPEVYREKVKVLEAHCEREKRDPATIARSLMCAYITGASEAEVQRKVEGLSAPPRANVLVGTPFQIVERIREYEAEGVSRIMMQHFNPPSREELAFVAEEILPRV